MVIIEQHPAFFMFINNILKVNFTPDNSKVISSVTEDGKIMGVTAFSRFSEHNCELSVASTTPRFMTKQYLEAVFHYPFVTCGKRRITAIIEDDNLKAQKVDKELGFVYEARLKNWYGSKDGIVMRMLEEECNWIKGRQPERRNKHAFA